VDRDGRVAHYLVHASPVTNTRGRVTHVLTMTTDITEIKRLQAEYNILFEQVPCYVAVLNRDLRIGARQRLSARGLWRTGGRHCWEILKGRTGPCEECPAEQTFQDGRAHSSAQVGRAKDGAETHYLVHTLPLPATATSPPASSKWPST